MPIIHYAKIVLSGQLLTREQSLAILETSDVDALGLVYEAWLVRRRFCGNRVQIQVLTNAKSGLCREDCHYCAQSCISQAEITRYPLKARDQLVQEARQSSR